MLTFPSKVALIPTITLCGSFQSSMEHARDRCSIFGDRPVALHQNYKQNYTDFFGLIY